MSVSHICKVAFNSSYHLQSCGLPRLDAEGGLVGGHDSKMAFKYSYHLQLCRLSKLDAEGVLATGPDSKMAFKSSYHLHPCWLPKLDAEGASVGITTPRWPLSLPTICSRVDYPS